MISIHLEYYHQAEKASVSALHEECFLVAHSLLERIGGKGGISLLSFIVSYGNIGI